MPRRTIGVTVFDAAVDRMVEIYERGDRVVVSMSGGKDSTCSLEVCVLAATLTDRLPVEAVTRDEEIMFPGTYEYLDRVWHREDVDLHHLVARQPIINCFDREQPYWWVFDPLLSEDEWVRKPPPYAIEISDLNIESMTTKERFPVDDERGQRLVSVVGLRVEESRGRMYGLFSAGGHMTKAHSRTGVVGARPIYDWKNGDVWRAIHDQGWDYNDAYDAMYRLGIPKPRMRVGPPTMNPASIEQLQTMVAAWPSWWDRFVDRIPSVRSAAFYGKRVLQPMRRLGEPWEETFHRECIEKAPAWIAERAARAEEMIVGTHRRHSSTPLPEVTPCHTCNGNNGSWKALAQVMYLGDPFSMKMTGLPLVEPEQFRPGSGRWNGTPV